jgi:hypothetical protein
MISPGNIQSSAFYDETEALLTIPVGEVVVYHPVELASRFYEAGMIHQNDKFFLQYQVEVFPYEGAPEVYELNAPDEVAEKETFSISFNYDDPQGTFEVSRCRVIMSSGFQLHFDLDGSGLFQSELLMFPEEGDNWIELYVKDKQGNESNRLRKNIRVKKWEPPGVFTLTGVLNHPACVEVCGSCCTDTELETVDGASYFIKESDIVLDDYVDGEEHAFRVYLTLETGSCDAGKCIYANILRVEEEM